MTPGRYDFQIVRGTTSPFIFRLKNDDGAGNLTPMVFEDVRLSIAIPDAPIVRTLVDGGLEETDPAEGEITWTPTPAESRSLPEGVPVRYEVEVWNSDSNESDGSDQQVYLTGFITGVGGQNDD